ncbi:MAG: PQQ-dependent sugar dehydrogenase [Nocardioides sp.]
MSTLDLTGTPPPTSLGPDVPTAPTETGPTATPTGSATGSGTDQPNARPGRPKVVDTIATDLTAPWGLDFFANGDAIVTERDTRRVLRIVGPDHEVKELGVLDAAVPEGEGGLLGVALSPDFGKDRLAYFYLTTATDNRIVRASLADGVLGEPEVLLDGIPNGFIHDGGRLEFGPDGYLYASTGEAGEPDLAQDRESLGGKVLRITTSGEPAPGNPFDSPVYSWGHRNIQGLAFDGGDRLWASEFGQDTFDELNRIEAGSNYGWPQVEGTGGEPDFVDPQQTWDVAEASPSGLAFADGSLWMASLRGERLWRVTLKGKRAVASKAFFVGDYGRMRTVALAPDGTLWLTTSNRDGRGVPQAGDDQILQITIR